MGFQNDYLLKLIEDLSAVFAAIALGEASPSKQIEEIDLALKDNLNVDPMFLFSGLKEQLQTIEPNAALIVADLLFLRAKALIALDRYFESSVLSAVDFANRARQGDAKSKAKATQLLRKILVHIENTESLENLLRTFEEDQQFGSAEDALFCLVKKNPEKFLPIGLAFYDRILTLDDFLLENGGLPRVEILESISELNDLA